MVARRGAVSCVRFVCLFASWAMCAVLAGWLQGAGVCAAGTVTPPQAPNVTEPVAPTLTTPAAPGKAAAQSVSRKGTVPEPTSPMQPSLRPVPAVQPVTPAPSVNQGSGHTAKKSENSPQPPPAPQLKDDLKASSVNRMEEAATAYAEGDYALAERIWRELADAGDGQAMNNLGVLYDLGQGVEMDVGRALHWFAESAKTGNTSGMSNYGRMLEQGRGMDANPEEAARWFDLAARQGQAEAQYNLGMLYELGRGVPKDLRAAAAWYSRAAAQQQTEAMFRLGHCYRMGQGVEKNASRAVLLFYAAAMNGDKNAMRALEDMARENAPRTEAVLFGQRLDNTDRQSMREVLKGFGVTVVREDDAHICDQYEAGKAAPGARRMALCYGPGPSAPLGFLELDYAAPDNKVQAAILRMVTERFGPASAGEGEDAHLWNLGSVIVATRFEPTRGLMSLMYMVPRVYHLTRHK